MKGAWREDASISIKFESSLPVLRSGKRKIIVNEYKRTDTVS